MGLQLNEVSFPPKLSLGRFMKIKLNMTYSMVLSLISVTQSDDGISAPRTHTAAVRNSNRFTVSPWSGESVEGIYSILARASHGAETTTEPSATTTFRSRKKSSNRKKPKPNIIIPLSAPTIATTQSTSTITTTLEPLTELDSTDGAKHDSKSSDLYSAGFMTISDPAQIPVDPGVSATPSLESHATTTPSPPTESDVLAQQEPSDSNNSTLKPEPSKEETPSSDDPISSRERESVVEKKSQPPIVQDAILFSNSKDSVDKIPSVEDLTTTEAIQTTTEDPCQDIVRK